MYWEGSPKSWRRLRIAKKRVLEVAGILTSSVAALMVGSFFAVDKLHKIFFAPPK